MLALYLFALGALFIAVACCAFCAAEAYKEPEEPPRPATWSPNSPRRAKYRPLNQAGRRWAAGRPHRPR